MAKSKRCITQLLLFSLLVCIVSGCDQGDRAKNKGIPAGDVLAFAESSQGLPKGAQWRNGLSLYDLNGDGLLDIFAPPARKVKKDDALPFAWLQNQDGSWRQNRLDVPSDVSYDYGDIAVSDFNKDGIADLVLAMHMSPLTLLWGTGDFKYKKAADDALPPHDVLTSRAVIAEDFNGDQLPDIAACSEANFGRVAYLPKGVIVCLQSKSGWSCGPIGDSKALGLYSDQILVGDVNGDGVLDIVVASLVARLNLVIWLGDGKGGFSPFNTGLPEEKVFYSVALADINGDGRDDLVASISGFGQDALYGPRVFISGVDGFTQMSEGLPEKENITAIAAADLDGNGGVEIIAGTGDGGITLYSQDGKIWKKKSVSGLPDSGSQRIFNIYCRDLNKDGKKDIVFNYASDAADTGGIRVFLNESRTKATDSKVK